MMNAKRLILLALAGVVTFFAGFFIGKDRTDKLPVTVSETSEIHYDTIPYFAPMPKTELTSGTLRYILPNYCFIGGWVRGEPQDSIEDDNSLCGKDSVIVDLPEIKRHYVDSTYEAWVSGPLDPRLDSVKVFAPTTVITKREWKPPKHWHIGVTAGYGYGVKGFQPYIGIGVTYSIFAF